MGGDEIVKIICPYCLLTIAERSQDHIFPDFLGGQRRISSCKKCNDSFGHTFEAHAAKFLQELHVFICSRGLTLKKDAIWREAYSHEGQPLDLSVGQGGVKMTPSRPVIKPNSEGLWSMMGFRTEARAQEAARRKVERGKIKDFRVEKIPLPQVFGEMEITLEIGPDLRRLALKMCLSLATLLPGMQMEEVKEARTILQNPSLDPLNTFDDYETHESLDSFRPPLSHVIYVERAPAVLYGVVQFFGVIQIYCRMGTANGSSESAALLAFLDPLTGDEQISTVAPLSLVPPPPTIVFAEYPTLIKRWLDKFRTETVKRGATHPPDTVSLSIEITPNPKP